MKPGPEKINKITDTSDNSLWSRKWVIFEPSIDGQMETFVLSLNNGKVSCSHFRHLEGCVQLELSQAGEIDGFQLC